jgi:RNA polymerase sigma-70 factor (ECF subfamily)
MVHPVDDAALIAGFLTGSAESHRQIDRWIREVLNHGAFGLGADAEDVAQEVRRKLLLALRDQRFQGAASLRTYVWKAAQYAAIDQLRARARKPRVALDDVPEPAASENPEADALDSERRRLAKRVVDALDAECRRLWALIAYEELPYAEIARRLGLTEGNVKVRALRCRRKACDLYRALVTSGGLARPYPGRVS